MFILFDSRLKISLEKKSRQIQAESSDFILNSDNSTGVQLAEKCYMD